MVYAKNRFSYPLLAAGTILCTFVGCSSTEQAAPPQVASRSIQKLPNVSVPLFPAPQNPGSALSKAQSALNEDRYRQALQSFQKAATISPQEPAVLRGTGVSLFRLGRYREAAQYFRRALTAAPGDADAHFDLATALAAQGQRGEAVSHYRRALQLNPAHADAALNLGLLYAALGKRADAVSVWREAQRQGVESAGIEHALGVSAFEDGNLTQAAERFRAALAIDRSFRLAAVGLGNIALRQGDLKQSHVLLD